MTQRLGRVAARAIRGYQLTVRPLMPATCRFAPSCSEYARQSLEQRGLLPGAWLAMRRLLRCHPFNPGGYDPPPVEPEPRDRGRPR
jgi:hypothetical protein